MLWWTAGKSGPDADRAVLEGPLVPLSTVDRIELRAGRGGPLDDPIDGGSIPIEDGFPDPGPLVRLGQRVEQGDPLELPGGRSVEPFADLHREIVMSRLVVVPDHVVPFGAQETVGVQDRVGPKPPLDPHQ